jgi:hypothetical protein
LALALAVKLTAGVTVMLLVTAIEALAPRASVMVTTGV